LGRDGVIVTPDLTPMIHWAVLWDQLWAQHLIHLPPFLFPFHNW
jgi:hypothetical protein